MRDFIDWLVTSSADPAKTSVALRGTLVLGGGYLLKLVTLACGLGFTCLAIDADWINSAVDAITNVVIAVLYLTGSGMTLFGLGRKVKVGRWSATPK